jgi:hypothetical protein
MPPDYYGAGLQPVPLSSAYARFYFAPQGSQLPVDALSFSISARLRALNGQPSTYGCSILAGQSNAANYFEPLPVPDAPDIAIPGLGSWIRCAEGGAGLVVAWAPGSVLRNQLIAAIAANSSAEMVMIWWVHGETDTILQADAVAYGDNMRSFASALEASTGRLLYWVLTSLHSNYQLDVRSTPERTALVNAGSATFVAEHPRSRLINPEGLALMADRVHYPHDTRIAMAARARAAARDMGLTL